MTLDDFKVELERLSALIDEPLAKEILDASGDPASNFGRALQVVALLPRDLTGKPSHGTRTVVSVQAHFEPVAYHYERTAP